MQSKTVGNRNETRAGAKAASSSVYRPMSGRQRKGTGRRTSIALVVLAASQIVILAFRFGSSNHLQDAPAPRVDFARDRQDRIAPLLVTQQPPSRTQVISNAEPSADNTSHLETPDMETWRILDEDGVPLRDARIAYRNTRGRWFARSSDHHGLVSLPVEPRVTGEIVCVHPRIDPFHGSLPPPSLESPGTPELRLTRAPKLSGVVQSRADGSPLRGAVVTFRPAARRGLPVLDKLVSAIHTLATRTDPDGQFVLEAAPRGPATLRVTSPGHVPWVAPCDPATTAEPPLKIELERGARVHGILLSSDGRPLVGATLRVCESGQPELAITTRSGRGGQFDLGVLPCHREVVLRVRHDVRGSREFGPYRLATNESRFLRLNWPSRH